MIKYNPNHSKYSGDSNMIIATKWNQSDIDKSKDDTRGKIVRLLANEVQLFNFKKI